MGSHVVLHVGIYNREGSMYGSKIILIILGSVKNSLYDNCKNTNPYSPLFPVLHSIILP